MLSCLYKGKPYIANDTSLSMNQKYDIADRREFLCPCCLRPVFYCHEGLKIAHFNHYEVGDCPEGFLKAYDHASSGKHERLTETFIQWIKKQFTNVEVIPDYLINRELKTDIYFVLGQTQFAIEIQFKGIPNPSFMKRREIYKKNGIKDIWFFINDEENYHVGSPYHRTYYRGNKREIYFYQLEDSTVKCYKGFVKEKWLKVGTHTLSDFVSVEVPLEHIKIGNNGRLIISELSNTYYQKLKYKRERTRSISDVEYQGVKDSPFGGSTNIKQTNVKVAQNEPHSPEYKEYYFYNEAGKEYLEITFLYQNNEYRRKYLILEKTISGKEKFLTCRIEVDSDNIRYSIITSPFLDSMKKVKIQRFENL